MDEQTFKFATDTFLQSVGTVYYCAKTDKSEDSFEAHKEDVYDMVDSALERWYGLGEVTEDQYDELRELADMILTIDFGGC